MQWGEKGPAPYGTQAPAKSTPGLSEASDKFLTAKTRRGTRCAARSAIRRIFAVKPTR